jgi:hypothetical protein
MDGLLKVILKLDPMYENSFNLLINKEIIGLILFFLIFTLISLSVSTYEYYQECLNILLVLLSTQIHQPNASQIENNYFLNILLTNFG